MSGRDIDVIVADPRGEELIVGECKWREHIDESQVIDTLKHRAGLFKGYRPVSHVLFTKHAASEGARRKFFDSNDVKLVTTDDLFQG